MKTADVSTMLRRTREQFGLTQRELAKLLDVDQADISAWECGAKRMRWPGLLKLALERALERGHPSVFWLEPGRGDRVPAE